MNIYVVIPAHNEEASLPETLQSLCDQTLVPKKIVVVNDYSSDDTQKVIASYEAQYPFITSVMSEAAGEHAPGSKVVEAFYKGFETLDEEFDVICKFDADLIFPKDYLQTISDEFLRKERCGIAGGFCYVEKNGSWVLEALTGKDHIRGALKAYRKECFLQIGGLKRAMGWDTVDELLTQFHGWQVHTLSDLHVKHLKPTGSTYHPSSKLKQGQAFKKMRYGFWLSVIASVKLAWKKRSFSYFWNCMRGYFSIKNDYLVTEEEGSFIRKLRWRNIKKKLS